MKCPTSWSNVHCWINPFLGWTSQITTLQQGHSYLQISSPYQRSVRTFKSLINKCYCKLCYIQKLIPTFKGTLICSGGSGISQMEANLLYDQISTGKSHQKERYWAQRCVSKVLSPKSVSSMYRYVNVSTTLCLTLEIFMYVHTCKYFVLELTGVIGSIIFSWTLPVLLAFLIVHPVVFLYWT